METQPQYKRDLIGAALVMVLGVVVIVAGRGYGIGSLTRMGAGYVPVALGVLLIVVGLLIVATTRRAPPPPPSVLAPGLPRQPASTLQWRGWGCILGGLAAFVLFGSHGGLVPATFAAVFISAMGDRKNTVRDAALLAAAITVAGVLIFNLALKLTFPLFTWS